MPKKRKALGSDSDQPLPAIASMGFWDRLKNPPPILAFAFPDQEDFDARESLGKLLRIPSVPHDDSVVYSIKIALDGFVPQIWRRIVTRSTDLENLHHMVQITMGWLDYHLHEFEVEKTSVPLADEGAPIDERGLTIAQLFKAGIKKFPYTYDFGDSWRHTIRIEKCAPADSSLTYPLCVAGKGISPVEDCGGVYMWGRILDALKHPGEERDADVEEVIDYVVGDIDLSPFSSESATKELHKFFTKKGRPRKRRS